LQLLFRFSLLTALLVTTIIAMAIVLAMQWRELGPLRAVVRRLRDEVGELSVDDPTKIHAIQVRTGDDLLWKWRIWIPEGETVFAHLRWGEISRTGYPKSRGSTRLQSGENWITLQAVRRQTDGQWMANMQTAVGGVGQSILKEAAWFDWPGGKMSTSDGVGFSTRVAESSERHFLLMRHRVGQVDSSTEISRSDAMFPGFIVWLERQAPASNTPGTGVAPAGSP
jgi:hypothetical protein